MPSPAAAVTSAFAYGVAGVVGGDECGNDAERDAGDERGDQGEGDDRQIHRHLVQAWDRDTDRSRARAGHDWHSAATPKPAMPPPAASTRLSVNI